MFLQKKDKPVEIGGAASFTQHLIRTAVEIGIGIPCQVVTFKSRQKLLDKVAPTDDSTMHVRDIEMWVKIADPSNPRMVRVLCEDRLHLECAKDGWRLLVNDPILLTIEDLHYFVNPSTDAVFPTVTTCSMHRRERWSGTYLTDRHLLED